MSNKLLEIFTGLDLVQTCGACPEQYDVTYKYKEAGYLRLRHGFFTVQYPDASGKIIYSAEPEGDGIFRDDERDYYLTMAKMALALEVIKSG